MMGGVPWRLGKSLGVWSVACATALTAMTAARSSAAFCRSTTNDKFEPTPAKMCDDLGLPLFWDTSCIGFSVQRDASTHPGLDLTTVRQHVQMAFDQWSSVDCADTGETCQARRVGRPAIRAQDQGPVVCGCREFNKDKSNANVIVFRDEAWAECDGTPKENPFETIALTTMTYNPNTGQIYDTDMEVNTKFHEITVGNSRVVYDLDSVLTHETGHVLGLAHTNLRATTASAPTMYYKYSPGDIFMRTLKDDDKCGICTVYPPDKAATCDAEPFNGFSEECGAEQGCHCNVVGRRPEVPAAGWAGLALAGLVCARARSRKRAA